MREKIKKQILNMLDTIIEAHNEIKSLLQANSNETAIFLMNECQESIINIGNSIASDSSEHESIIDDIVAYNDLLFNISMELDKEHNADKIFSGINDSIIKIKNRVSNEIIGKYEILFLPYKSSMWDSMESIYLAAKEDPRCNAVVMPIPYYDRENGGAFGKLNYEGDKFPKEIPIIDFSKYNIEAMLPDVIYIHNPYNDWNLVTSVHPYFYSSNLKKYTNCLVYVPYFICGAYKDLEAFKAKHALPIIPDIDYFIAQSDFHKELLEKIGYPAEKVLALGSPKVDKIVNMKDKMYKMPKEWEEKIKNKKVIVLNSSIGSMLGKNNYFENLEEIIKAVMSFDEILLIWRPHPLLEATIKSMRPYFLESYNKILSLEKVHKNMIIDLTSDTTLATYFSDAMITDISSWMRQYIITKKPILMLNGVSSMRENYLCVFDHFSNYFGLDGCTVKDFCINLINNIDEKQEEREKYLLKSVNDLSGQVGEKIHDTIINKIEVT